MTTGAAELARNARIALLAVALMWAVFFLNTLFPPDFRQYGVVPRQAEGLWGIFLAPFLHGSLNHLTANSGPLFVLLAVSLSFSRMLTTQALGAIVVIGGMGVWVFGRPHTVHIGASGVIFGLIGFLVFIGIFGRRWKTLVLSLVVFFAYGGAIMTLFIHMPGVSWSSHFWGFAAGVLAAWRLAQSRSARRRRRI
jgi:membrane associated rhomboid family serine protease